MISNERRRRHWGSTHGKNTCANRFYTCVNIATFSVCLWATAVLRNMAGEETPRRSDAPAAWQCVGDTH